MVLATWHPIGWLALAGVVAVLAVRRCRRVWPASAGHVPGADASSLLLLAVVIRVAGDLAKMAGYPVGVVLAAAQHAPAETWAKRQW